MPNEPPLSKRTMPSQPMSTPSGAPAIYENSRRVDSGICVCFNPASAISARTCAGPTAASAMSVAVLSLCAIIASSTLRAWVVPASLRKTRLLAERTASSTFICWSSVSRPASTSRRYCARMKVLTALPTNSRAAGSCAARHGVVGWSTATRQLAVAGIRAKRSTAACTRAAPSAAAAV